MQRFLRRAFNTQKQEAHKLSTPTQAPKIQKTISNNIYRPVSNLNTILDNIDTKLGVNKPPSIEYLYVVPHVAFSLTKLRNGLYSTSNPYGHSAIRYTLSNGEQYVMNIVGKPGRRMVNFLSPKDYLFGDPCLTCKLGSEQGGVFHRSIIGFRLENFPLEQVDKLHEYYIELQNREIKKNEIKFNIFAVPGWIKIPFLTKAYERGNCALWTSKGFKVAGLFKQSTIFPKYIFVKLYMKSIHSWGWYGMYNEGDNQRCNIVSYNQVVTDDEKEKVTPTGITTPLLFSSSNRNFRNLKRFAHCNVDLDTDYLENGDVCYRAKVEAVDPWIPKWLGSIWKH